MLEQLYLGSGASDAEHRDHPLQLPHGRRASPSTTSRVKLYERLSVELGLQRHVHPARPPDVRPHRARDRRACACGPRRTSSLGVDSRVIFPDEIARAGARRWTSRTSRASRSSPALYHPPGGIIRHDAVVWGYARGAERLGIEIHPYTEVTGIDVADGRVDRRRDQPRPDPRRRSWSTPRPAGPRRSPQMVGLRAADRDPSAAGAGHRAAQAVPGPGDRVGDAARLRQPDRPRRAGHRRGDRPVRLLQHALDAAVPGERRRATRWSCCRASPASRCCASGPASAT